MTDGPEREPYYRAAASWADDRRDLLRASRRTAWIVAGVATIVALCEAAALVALTPLKTVVPYTLLVDRTTGYVQALKPLDAERIAPDSALTQSFLVQYVIARESFDINALQANYRKVVLWSAEAALTDYVAGVQVTNPASPLARLPRTTTVETFVKSVSPLGGTAALVRFETRRRDAGGRAQPPRAWVAVIRYRFSATPLGQADRFVNPLGFQVVRYRRDQEQLPPEPDPPPPADVRFPDRYGGPETRRAVPLPSGLEPRSAAGPYPSAPPPAIPTRPPSRPSRPEVAL